MEVFGVKNVVLREGEVDKTNVQTRDAREVKSFEKLSEF